MPLLTNTFQSFGLDIGDRSLKAAYVKKRGSDFVLESYAEVAVPEGVVIGGDIRDQAMLAKLMKQLARSVIGKRLPSFYVHACLPETQTFIKLLTLSAESIGELPTRIKEELPNHIPLDPNDIYLDWNMVSYDAEQKSARVLVGAVPQKVSEEYTSSLLAAGLKPISLQIEAEPIVKSVIPWEEAASAPIGIIDMGATRSSFVCYDEGTIQFTVSMPTAADGITETIGRTLKLTAQEAEQAKRVCGADPAQCDGALVPILTPILKDLADSISKNISFYSEHFHPKQKISQIILCGGGANMPNLAEVLSTLLPDVEVRLADPLVNFIKNRKRVRKPGDTNLPRNVMDGFLPQEHLSAATAIGLAMANVLHYQ